MIHTNRVVTVGEQESIIDRPIVLYRGDREVEIEFELVGNEFMFSNEGNVIKTTNASYGQLVLNTPTGEHMFSELSECHDGKVAFIVTKEMIDELIEVGFYSFQIRLFDESQVSRVTLPPILNGFDIRNPIASEDETNVTDLGVVDYSRVGKDEWEEDLPTFNWDGSYNKTEWQHHDVIYTNKLNKIEDALYSINANVRESDVVMLNTLDQVKKDADAYVKEHIDEVEQDVEDFERSINTGVEQFKIDTNAAMTAHTNEVSEELESFNSQLAYVMQDLEVNVKNFGAKGDGSICDEAVTEAIKYVESKILENGYTGWKTACATIKFPAGKYTITQRGVLSSNIDYLAGFNIKGEGYRNTVINYEYEGSEEDGYLFQVGGKQGEDYKKGAIGYSSVSDISIVGNNTNKFFGLYSRVGSPTSFRFNNVYFDRLMEFVSIRYGTSNSNADMFKFHQCKCMDMPENSTIFSIFDNNNSQSVAHEFTQCDFNTKGTIWNIKSGGCINAYGGSWTGSETSTLFIIENTNGNIGPSNNMYTLYGVRPEIRKINQNSVLNDGVLFKINGNINLTFNDITFGQLSANSDNVRYGLITSFGRVTFNNCHIPSSFKIGTSVLSSSYAYSYKPSINYVNSIIESEIGLLIEKLDSNNTPGNSFIANAINCKKYRTSSESIRMPVDVTINEIFGYSDNCSTLKTFNFSNNPETLRMGIPIPTTLDSTREFSFKMPIGAKIIKIKIVYLKTNTYASFTKQFNIDIYKGDSKKLINNITLDMDKGSVNDYVPFCTTDMFERITESSEQLITFEVSGDYYTSGGIPGFISVEYY